MNLISCHQMPGCCCCKDEGRLPWKNRATWVPGVHLLLFSLLNGKVCLLSYFLFTLLKKKKKKNLVQAFDCTADLVSIGARRILRINPFLFYYYLIISVYPPDLSCLTSFLLRCYWTIQYLPVSTWFKPSYPGLRCHLPAELAALDLSLFILIIQFFILKCVLAYKMQKSMVVCLWT